MTMTETPLGVPATPGEVVFKALDAATMTLLRGAVARKDERLAVRYDFAHQNQLGQGGEYWRGRQPATGTIQDVLPQLVTDDQIGPAMGREVAAQFGRDPEWDAFESGNTTALKGDNEVVKALTDWHAEADLTGAAKKAAANRFWAGRKVGRVYIPSEYAADIAAAPPATLDEALAFVHVQAIDPREGGPLIDGHGRTLGYWCRYPGADLNGTPFTLVEVHTRDVIQTYRVDGESFTAQREADNPFFDRTKPMRPRRSEFLMWHVDRDGGSAITETMLQGQGRHNAVTSYMGFNDDQTGYPQLVVTNTELPKDDDGKPTGFELGPGVVLRLIGTPYDDSTASDLEGAIPRRHDPHFEVIPPSDPSVFHIPTRAEWKRIILEPLDQLWTLSPETQVSGESKRQSRKPFDQRVTFAGQDAGNFIAWALRAALMLAAQLIGQTEKYAGVTFRPRMYLDVDTANLEEARQKLAQWQAGGLSLVSLLEATPGVIDVSAEEKRIAAERAAREQDEGKRTERLDSLLGARVRVPAE